MISAVKLLDLYDAIELGNHMMVRKILRSNLHSQDIPSRELCGLAIIAAEMQLIHITKEFILYNFIKKDGKLAKYLVIAMNIHYKINFNKNNHLAYPNTSYMIH